MRKLTVISKTALFFTILMVSHLFATEFLDIRTSADQVGLYRKFEIRFQVSRSYDNPFDPSEVAINCIFTTPEGKRHTVPAFWFQDFELKNIGGVEKLYHKGEPEWRVRYAPMSVGEYSFFLQITDSDGFNQSETFGFECIPSDSKGFIRVDHDNPHYLSFDDGSFYLPMGQNVGWANEAGSFWYEKWMNRMAEANENWIRIWCTHFYNGQLLEWNENHPTRWYHGIGRYSLQGAWKWDYMVDLAEELGLYIQMVTQHHGQFSQSVNPNWDENPYNIKNGGFLNSGDEFFNHPYAKDLYKRKMRYTIARWGYSTAILAWELWNEVQYTDNYAANYPNVAEWHREMAEYIHHIDPWRHPVTTSARDGDSLIWALPSIDITQNHYYGPNVIDAVQQRHLMMEKYGKPNIVGEFGDDWRTGGKDRSGTVVHQGIWAAAMVGTGAMPWWWDNYIHPYNLYYHWKALAAFWQGEDFRGGDFAPAECRVHGGPSSAAGKRAYPGLNWTASLQKEFTVLPDGTVPGIEKLSHYLQGSDKAEMGREAIFHTSFPTEVTFGVHVLDVSSWHPGVIRIYLDDRTQPLIQETAEANRTYSVTIPAGEHRIRVYNAGIDWFMVEYYQFVGIRVPAATAQVFTDGETAYVWVRDADYIAGESPHGTMTGVSLVLAARPGEEYRIEQWNTFTGERMFVRTVTSQDSLRIALDDFEGDTALKIKPAGISRVEGRRESPEKFRVYQNYPNPFNLATIIPFELEKESRVEISVFNTSGQLVKNVFAGKKKPGYYELKFAAAELSAGLYFVRLKADDEVRNLKALLLK